MSADKQQKVSGELAARITSNQAAPLTGETKTAFFVNYRDIQVLVDALIPTEEKYSISAAEEIGNDRHIVIAVTGRTDAYGIKMVENYALAGGSMPRLAYVLDYLAALGKVETGSYVISVSW